MPKQDESIDEWCFTSTCGFSETKEVESICVETPHTVEKVTHPSIAVDNSAEEVQPSVETLSEMQETDTNPAKQNTGLLQNGLSNRRSLLRFGANRLS